ncbi:MAG TPA: hypothetical protein DCY86_08995 [Bdellovibrionales bacterium]|nr:hypothetical protein [Bdellovibrionales bacterium]
MKSEKTTKKISLFLFTLMSLIYIGGSMSVAQNQPPVRYVVFHKPGPQWQQGVDFRQQPGVRDHVQHYMKLYQDGKLALGGPFLDNSGGMMVPVEGTTLEEIQSFAETDPAVKSGLLVIEIRPWMIAMEK